MKYVLLCLSVLLAATAAEAKDLTVAKLEGAAVVTVFSEKLGDECKIIPALEHTGSGEKLRLDLFRGLLESQRRALTASRLQAFRPTVDISCEGRDGGLGPDAVRSNPLLPMRENTDTSRRLSALPCGARYFLYD